MKSKQTCAYLYADGHAVIIHEQTVNLGGKHETLEYAVIHEKWTNAHLSFQGRLCLGRYEASVFMRLAKEAIQIRASVPSVESGSDNTRKLGIAVGSLSFEFRNGEHIHWTVMPDLISGPFTYQPDHNETFDPERTNWGMCKVTKIIRAPIQEVKVAA